MGHWGMTLALAVAAPLLLIGAGPADAPAKPRVRAVVIGVAGYTVEKNGMKPLVGAYNDAMLISDTLIRDGAKREDIILLVDEPSQAQLVEAGEPKMRTSAAAVAGIGTRANIIAALKKLVETTKAGDEVVISFSGHGFQQKEMVAGSEPDGLDEIFMPIDTAPSTDGERFAAAITDDEIGATIDAIRAKGGNVFYIGDFCHSGDSNRSAGGKSVAPDRVALNLKVEPKYATAANGAFVRDMAVEVGKKSLKGAFVGFMAAPSDTQAKQDAAPKFSASADKAPHGLLTIYAMMNLTNPRVVTFRDLATRINSNIDQHKAAPRPLFDGDLDRPVLGGAVRSGDGAAADSWTVLKETTPYDDANPEAPVKLTQLELSAGELMGVRKDAVIGLALQGREGEKTVLYGKVDSVDAYKAKLVPASYGDIPATAWDNVLDVDGRRLTKEVKFIATMVQAPVDLDYRIALPRLPASPGAAQTAAMKAFGQLPSSSIGAKLVPAGTEADLALAFDADGKLTIDEPIDDPQTDFGALDIAAIYAAGGADPDLTLRIEIGQALVRATKFARLRRVLANIGATDRNGDDDPAKALNVSFFVQRPAGVRAGAECPDTDAPFYTIPAGAQPLSATGQSDAGAFELQRCDWLFVEIANGGKEEIYVNPLIFSPDGSITLVKPKRDTPERFPAGQKGVLQYQLTDTRPGSALRDDLIVLVSDATDGTAVSYKKLQQCAVAPGPEDSKGCQGPASLAGGKLRSGGGGSAIEELIDSALDGNITRGGTAARPTRTTALRFSWLTRPPRD